MSIDLIATYRLQLGPTFGFGDATKVVAYLRDLGISHLYLSPCFEATTGSTHGYDVVDPNRLREELGGRDAFDELVSTAHDHGLGVIIDIVPHHMAATADNAWWWSVLERGRESPYAGHFDIDWDPPEERLRGVVLLPVLGDHYGRVLDAGDLRLDLDDDRIVARYFDHVAPLSPPTADEIWAEAGRRSCDVRTVISELNADVDRLDAVLNRQHHRFARWQTAAHDLDYRRFFDIDALVALRSERPAVFDDAHRLVTELVRSGHLDGVRVDHVDGLRDPQGYLARLRATLPGAWIGVEKILRPKESLPSEWPVDGTTGYEFLADVAALLVDPAGLDRLIDAYAEFTGDTSTYAETSAEARREALRDALDADLRRVVRILVKVCEQNRRWRDFTRAELREALTEICAHAPAYRSYVRAGVSPTDADRAFVDTAIETALAAQPTLDADLLGFLHDVLTGEIVSDDASELVARFQQLTGPVAAKGDEDTAFYRWVPFLCLNEVGTDPSEPAIGTNEFHARNQAREERRPSTMLTTATHDTKRGEDVRARLATLSESPDEWAAAVVRWHEMNDRHRDRKLDAPDRRDEWFIYETLAGAHPLPGERAWVVIEKSLREAKRRTDWVRVDEDYERATRSFVEAILADDAFNADLDRMVSPLVEPGLINALTQVALRLLSPGVPDTYQGTELWDSSLVDPDNRRPVDFARRRQELDAIRDKQFDELWPSARAKLALVHTCLRIRRRIEGAYTPLRVGGDASDRVIAFARGNSVAVVAARWPMRGLPDDATVELPPGEWTNVLSGKPHSGTVTFGELRGLSPLAVLQTDFDPVG